MGIGTYYANDPELYARLCRVSVFLDNAIEEDWAQLTDQEENNEYLQRLASYDITESDVAYLQGGAWEILEGDHPDRNGFISLYRCSNEWVEWRW
jgi:hypothetical protein